MRLFAALTLTPQMQTELLDAVTVLRTGGKGSFTRPENLHLTLAFIGETDRAAAAMDALSRLEAEPFFLYLQGTGNFDSLVWAGIAPNPALEALAGQLYRLLRDAGFTLQAREFIPHITLARRYEPLDGHMPRLTLLQTGMTVESISLMKSEHIDGKQVYTELYRRYFGGNNR